MVYMVIAVECEFHNFHFRPGFIWGKTDVGQEFATSGWCSDDGTEYFVYRRQPNGEWIGHWELAVADDCGNWWKCAPHFFPASDVAQLLRSIAKAST